MSLSPQAVKKRTAQNRYKKIVDFKNLARLSANLHKQGKKIVFTTGSFEVVTPGHCRFLAEARACGDVLVVGLCSDRSISKLKGPDYPLLNQDARSEMLTYLRSVDYVTVVDEGEPHAAIVLLAPDIFYTNTKELENGNVDEQAEFLLKRAGGKLVVCEDHNPYKSARDLIEHVADLRFTEIVASYLWSKHIAFGLDSVPNFKPADYGDQTPQDRKAFNPAEFIYKDKAVLEAFIQERARLGWTTKAKLVFVSGSYDLLHVGHARFVEKASLLGDFLLVGIPSDAKIKAMKGYGRPIISEYSRAYVLASLDFVDGVYIFDDFTVADTLATLKPNVFFTVAEEWNSGLKQSPEYKIVRKSGGRVVTAPRQSPFLSSSSMINRMAAKKVKDIFKECMDEDKIKLMQREGSKFKLHAESDVKKT